MGGDIDDTGGERAGKDNIPVCIDCVNGAGKIVELSY